MFTPEKIDIFDRFRQKLENEFNLGEMSDDVTPYSISVVLRGIMDYAEMDRCAGSLGLLGERLSKFIISGAHECNVNLRLTSALTSGFANEDVFYQNIMLELEPDILPSTVYTKDDFCFSIDNYIPTSASDAEYEDALAQICTPFISSSLSPKP